MRAYYSEIVSLKTKTKLGDRCIFDILKKFFSSIVHGKTESTKAVCWFYYPMTADISEKLDHTDKPSLNCPAKY